MEFMYFALIKLFWQGVEEFNCYKFLGLEMLATIDLRESSLTHEPRETIIAYTLTYT
ncbi:hypothetical protein KSX_17370 [Ktedonospora formicarum]|uniref:Uncharacterized protein n=1 Tax=Ktedonospora formicarum TaxID=2778364 RepID=A0A8J3HTS7_9CHLR|nr:hypothetical protein KSX_17370 [Ktedonospora formicarum]